VLDGSERSDSVFRCAVALAEPRGASIHLLCVIAAPPELPPEGHVSRADGVSDYPRGQAEAELRAFAGLAPHLHVETTVIESRQPWGAIVDAAEDVDADLIVVGSHGYDGLDYLLGTNAGRVANLLRRNVLVAHARPDDRQVHRRVHPYRHANASASSSTCTSPAR
jgi:nucleotide-binding universal stress UspA family protein